MILSNRLAAYAMPALFVATCDGEARAQNVATSSHVSTEHAINEAQAPVTIDLTYTGEVMSVARGGLRRGARYLDNLDLVADADLGRTFGWSGATFHIYGLYNNGQLIGDLAGDAESVSNIETGVRALRLYEAWIDQRIGAASLRGGFYDLNSEFDSLATSRLFVGSQHGIGTEIGQSGRNGPSIFPSTSLAARIALRPAKRWAIRVALLDGVPGDPASPGRTVVRLRRGDGALAIGEIETAIGRARLITGHWRYTARFETWDGGSGRGNAGSYVRGETDLRRGWAVFARLGMADGRFNMFDRFVAGGITLARKPDAALGIAISAAFTARRYRLANGGSRSETVIEASYRREIAPGLSVHPDVQYVRRPAGDSTAADALVVGLRFALTRRLIG